MLCIIAAIDENNAIGFKNRLLYNLPQDMQRFKAMTFNKTVIMGKNTYFSLKIKPLPNRKNIVLTRTLQNIEATVCTNLRQLADLIKNENDDIFVIGGESVYRLLLPFCRKAYITKVFAKSSQYDAVFPDFGKNWILTEKSSIMTTDEGIKFSYFTYENTAPAEL